MKKLGYLFAAIGLALFASQVTFAGAPYDVTVTFDTNGADSYNFYIDDCAVGGPTAAPFASVTPGQTFSGALTADGTYLMCVRGVNGAGEQPDPGDVATITVADLPIPAPIGNLQISIECPLGGCTVNITVN